MVDCSHCRQPITGIGVEVKCFGHTVYRHSKCHREIRERRRENIREQLPDPGVVHVAEGHCETTAKYKSKCMGCFRGINVGSRVVWKMGTKRLTWHPRCWRNKGQYGLTRPKEEKA